ncbi:MAG: PAS domain S-box protein [Cyanobacteriota bacterium]|nr:PAS domain S-box protein [Cyanobacteriota bacterium]
MTLPVARDPYFDHCPDLLWVMDEQGYLCRLNPAWEKTLGFPLESWQGIPYLERVHPDDRAIVAVQLRKMRKPKRRQETLTLEHRCQTQSGQYRWLAWVIGAYAEDHPGWLCGTARDVTTTREAESERRFRTIFENAALGIALTDSQGRIVDSNPALQAMHARSQEELQNLSFSDLTHPEDLALDMQLYQDLIAGKRSYYQIEKRYVRRDGIIFWGRLTVSTLPNVDGQVEFTFAMIEDITLDKLHTAERDQALAAARLAEAKNEALLSAIPDLIFRVNREGVYLDFRIPSHFPTLLTAANYVGKRMQDVLPPDVYAQRMHCLTQALETGEMQMLAYQLEIEGKDHIYEGRFVPCGSDEVLGVVRDITEERQSEAALRQSETWLRMALAAAQMGAWSWNLQTNEEKWTPELAALYGKTPDSQHTYEEFLQLVHPQDRAYLQEKQQAALTEGIPYICEYRFIRSDGVIRWMANFGNFLRDESGQAYELMGVAMDITEAKQAEQERQESLSLLKATLESTADGILVVNLEGKCLSYNHKFLEMWDFDDSEMQESSVAERIRMMAEQTQDSQVFIDRYQQLMNSEEIISDWVEMQDGRTLERYTQPQKVCEQIIGRVWSYRDVTERRKIERMKNEFVSMVSHELRTPLTSVRGSLGLIMGGIGGEISGKTKELIEIAYKNSERLILLINDILDIEKIESGKMRFDLFPTPLVPLIEQSIEANLPYAQQFNVHFILEKTSIPQNLQVNIDSQRLLQVMANLLSNAAKFSPVHEQVRIEITQRDPLIPGEADGVPMVRVSVKDAGSGIPEAFRPRIFQKFAQADASDSRQKGGTGLGLSISKVVIEKMGGQIGFDSQVNVGTTFYFDLPIYESPPLLIEGSHQQVMILVCEDDPDIANLLSLMLGQHGFGVVVAHSAQQAKQKLVEQTFAAMTLDLMLPDQDGISLIKELRKNPTTQHLPVVVVSARARLGSQELKESGFAVLDCLDKPVDQHLLLAAVKRAIQYSGRERAAILHIEDDLDISQIVITLLQDIAQVYQVKTLKEARRFLKDHHIDLILLDIGLPDGSGLDLLTEINHQPTIPVVIFSAQEVSPKVAQNVAATLVKSRTLNQELLQTIKTLIGVSPKLPS